MLSLRRMRQAFLIAACLTTISEASTVSAQEKSKKKPTEPPTAEELAEFETKLGELSASIIATRNEDASRAELQRWADATVCEAAARRMLRFKEFPATDSANHLTEVIELGHKRARRTLDEYTDTLGVPGTTVRGFVSDVDGSAQPYALTLPGGFTSSGTNRWPLHVVLHGRSDQMNEVSFIRRHEGKPLKPDSNLPTQNWIQLDVYGRGNNAYRWAGESDVFEAVADVKRRFRIDDNRVTLHGFSMGGAGAWHLGLHHPTEWSSVGPGAGFVDFYRYQKKDAANVEQRLPETQHRTLSIYDSVNYALNAFNVPVCTYGGEDDPQLLASTTMKSAAEELSVPIKVIVGPKMGHKFDPASQREFMEFHVAESVKGRPPFGQRKQIRFVTHTLRYNRCDWLRIEEQDHVYEPTTVEAGVTDSGDVVVTTNNVRALRITRDVGSMAVIDGKEFPLRDAADGLLPDVWFVRSEAGWDQLSYDESRSFEDNPQRHKRHGLQGPIDDAFMSSFVCVRGTGTAWNDAADNWSKAVLTTFEREFAQWMRGDLRIVDDSQVNDELIRNHHLILFGDPGSNAIIQKVLPDLPLEWTREHIRMAGRDWSAADHGVCLIFPNPLNPSKYVVLNSGHTFHEKDFRSSNAWLFPRLGDAAVLKLNISDATGVEWSGIFDSDWKL